jgi:hypothetical protein
MVKRVALTVGRAGVMDTEKSTELREAEGVGSGTVGIRTPVHLTSCMVEPCIETMIVLQV